MKLQKKRGGILIEDPANGMDILRWLANLGNDTGSHDVTKDLREESVLLKNDIGDRSEL